MKDDRAATQEGPDADDYWTAIAALDDLLAFYLGKKSTCHLNHYYLGLFVKKVNFTSQGIEICTQIPVNQCVITW